MSNDRSLRFTVRRGVYHDSLVLMGVHAALGERHGVIDAGAIMASRANLELLAASGLKPEPAPDLDAEDLLVVVEAVSIEAAEAALAVVDDLLKSSGAGRSESFRPRSLDGALRQLPGAQWVAVSVPGDYAASLARDALYLDLNVFLYSDNVDIEDEVELKRIAAARDLMVLGPDCGTAILGGVGLGFANRVRRGSIGLVGASGTGLQSVAVALDRLGSGVSQAIGTGGRDLSRGVAAATTLRALDRLAQDDATAVVVLVSKAPDAEVAERVIARAAEIGKPVVVYFQGAPRFQDAPDFHGTHGIEAAPGIHLAASLRHAARLAHALASGDPPPPEPDARTPRARLRKGHLRGLFAGGTLAAETLWALSPYLDPLHSNLAGPWKRLDAAISSQGHTILDLGDDTLTRGRLHPMLDPSLQVERLRHEAADPGVGTILLDVVLGDGAHPDPATLLAPAIESVLTDSARQGCDLEVVALVIGTPRDPQNLDDQVARLLEAGAIVVEDVEAVVAVALGRGDDEAGRPPVPTVEVPGTEEKAAIEKPAEPHPSLAVVNVGLETFHASLRSQGVEAVHVEWRPPAGGNAYLAAILERLKSRDREHSPGAAR